MCGSRLRKSLLSFLKQYKLKTNSRPCMFWVQGNHTQAQTDPAHVSYLAAYKNP